jgi:hypothetical protein
VWLHKYMPILCFASQFSCTGPDSTVSLKSKSHAIRFLRWVTTSDPHISRLGFRKTNLEYRRIDDLFTRRLQQIQLAWFNNKRTTVIKLNVFTCARSHRLQRHWFNLKRSYKKRISRLINWMAKGSREQRY